MPKPTDLPLKETGFHRLPTLQHHRCDIIAEGFAIEAGQRVYDYDNRNRDGGCLFQYTISGEGSFQTVPDGRRIPLPAGSAFLIPFPSPTRYWLAPGQEWEFCYVILGGDMVTDLLNHLVRQYGYIWQIPPTHPAIDVIRNLHRRVLENRVPDEYESSAMAYRLMMELFRVRQSDERPLPAGLGAAVRLMERQYRNPDLSIVTLAAAAGCSRFHFARLFRRETGTSPSVYLQQLRIRRALELITSTQLPIKQIAAETGYRDCAYFCKEFKRWTRRTPASVRRMGASLNLTNIHTG